MLDVGINKAMVAQYAPRPGRYPLIPALSPRQQVALTCRMLQREGYNDHIAGHITLRLPDGTFLANPWELTWSEITASDIVQLDAQGRVIDGDWNITPAINLHLEIHARRPDVDVIIHNHPRWGSVWAAAGRVPPIYDQTSAMVDSDPVLFDEYSGTVEDAARGRDAVAALGEHKWALLENHGVLVVADNIRQAHLRAITLEWRCRLAWQVEQLGGGKALPKDVANQTGARTDTNGFPFLWEAMAREEIRRNASVLN